MSQGPSIQLETWQPAAPPPEDNPAAVIDWAADRFVHQRVVMTSSFGMEGVALMHLVSRRYPELRVIYIDTGFFFEETHRLRDKLSRRFPQFRFECIEPQLTPAEQAEAIGPELWRKDPDTCCRIRKVEPMHRALRDVDVWFTSLRRDQSPSRWNTKVVDWNWTYQLIKICPLVTWTRQDVYRYIREHELPYNELHDRGFPTVGCTHCTAPVNGSRPWDYSREGRWAGTQKTECGLHGDGI